MAVSDFDECVRALASNLSWMSYIFFHVIFVFRFSDDFSVLFQQNIYLLQFYNDASKF